MKHKRLNRDGWGFRYYPYYQIRIDDDLFHGTVCLIRRTERWCAQIRQLSEDRIAGGEPVHLCRETAALKAGKWKE